MIFAENNFNKKHLNRLEKTQNFPRHAPIAFIYREK